LSKIEIVDYGPIKHLEIPDIPKNSQWIFLTGENGTGKTSILKALAVAITNNTLKLGPRTSVQGEYKISLELNKFGKTTRYKINRRSNASSNRKLQITYQGFVAFGPIRVNIAMDESEIKTDSEFNFEELLDVHTCTLFSTHGYLVDIGHRL
jgi:predicted ATP-dependent endonuclease of OLD family